MKPWFCLFCNVTIKGVFLKERIQDCFFAEEAVVYSIFVKQY